MSEEENKDFSQSIEDFLQDNEELLSNRNLSFLQSVNAFYKKSGFFSTKQVQAVERIFNQVENVEIDSFPDDGDWQ